MRPYSCIDGAMESLCIQVVDASRTIRHRWWFRCGSLLRTAMWVVWVQTWLRKPLVWGSQRGSTHAVGQLTCKDFNKVNIKASRSIWGASKSSHRTKCRWIGRICSWLYRHSIVWLLEKPCTIHLLINEIAEESLHVFEYSIRLLRIVYILDDLNKSVNKQHVALKVIYWPSILQYTEAPFPARIHILWSDFQPQWPRSIWSCSRELSTCSTVFRKMEQLLSQLRQGKHAPHSSSTLRAHFRGFSERCGKTLEATKSQGETCLVDAPSQSSTHPNRATGRLIYWWDFDRMLWRPPTKCK